MSFIRAERKQAKLRLALVGPSGSGKTYSALQIASGIGEKIAFIDTEHFSGSLYSDLVPFDVLNLEPPYSVARYGTAIDEAVAGGYDVLIIDSISHAWAGEGGLLDEKAKADARGGNSFSNWDQITKKHEAFKAKLLNCDVHLIVTMRAKQDYSQEKDDRGKTQIKKVGLAPIQRDGMEYEFTTVFDIAMNHEAIASKDRTGLFDGMYIKPDKKTGETLKKWLDSGAKPTPPLLSADQCFAVIKQSGWTTDQLGKVRDALYKVGSAKDLSVEQLNEFVKVVKEPFDTVFERIMRE